MMKLALMRPATGMEDPELPLLQRISTLVPASEIAAQINASQSSSNRHFNINCSDETCELGLHGRIAANKPLLKDTKKHKKWTLDRWKYVLWSGVQIRDF